MHVVICIETQPGSRMSDPAEYIRKIVFRGKRADAIDVFDEFNKAKKRLLRIAKTQRFNYSDQHEMVHGYEVNCYTTIYLEME